MAVRNVVNACTSKYVLTEAVYNMHGCYKPIHGMTSQCTKHF